MLKMVERTLGYVHIQSMGDDSFRTVYSDILGNITTAKAL